MASKAAREAAIRKASKRVQNGGGFVRRRQSVTDPETGDTFYPELKGPIKCDRYDHCHTEVNDPSLLNKVDGRWLCAPCESFIRDLSAQVRDQQ